MAKIIALCGKICSGKSTYAAELAQKHRAVVLNPDVLMKTLFGEHLGARHEEVFASVQQYLYQQAKAIAGVGIDVVLDFGLWTQAARRETRAFFEMEGVDFAIHYVNTPLHRIRLNIEKRNGCVDETQYFIDDAILEKCLSRFEEPTADEIDLEVHFDACDECDV